MKIVKQTKEFIIIQSERGACFKININEFPLIEKILETALAKTNKAIEITLNFKNK